MPLPQKFTAMLVDGCNAVWTSRWQGRLFAMCMDPAQHVTGPTTKQQLQLTWSRPRHKWTWLTSYLNVNQGIYTLLSFSKIIFQL